MDERAARVEELLGRSGWVRRLARELVGEERAEDLAQRTLLAGLERDRRDSVPLGRWLAAVMRNLARSDWRAGRRREQREAHAARGEAQAGPDELLARFEAQGALAEAVRALEEPYRSAILLRYYEDLPPRVIASRLGTNVRTVNTRLHRGLAMLRGRLDRSFGDRAAWLGALVPLARDHAGSIGAWTGAFVVKTKITLAAAAAVLACSVYFLWHGVDSGARRVETIALDTGGEQETEERAPLVAEESGDAARREASAADPSPSAAELLQILTPATAPAAPARAVRGRVADVRGEAVAGVRVAAYPEGDFDERSCTLTDDQGRFELERESVRGALRVEDPGWATLYRAFTYPNDPEWLEPLIVVAPRIELAGRVVDPEGAPWPGAQVVLLLDNQRHNLGISDRSELVQFEATADEQGRFEMPVVPALEPLILSARAREAVVRTIDVKPYTDRNLQIVLEHAVAQPGLQGIVFDAEGRAVHGATVRADSFSVETNGDGTFVLPDDVAQRAREVVACVPGFQPGRTVLRDPTGASFVEPPVVVRVGPPTPTIQGRVVDPSGRPMPGVEVRALGLTWSGEREAGGRPRGWAGVRLEDFSTWNGPGLFTQNDTDVEGRFTLGGLFERSYVLGLLDRASLRYMMSAPIPARTRDVELVFAPDGRTRRISGRVVDREGNPVPFAQLRFRRDVERTTEVDGVLAHEMESTEAYQQADGSGAFETGPLAVEARIVRVSFVDDLAYAYELEGDGDLTGLELVAWHRAHLRVDMQGSSSSADAFELLDERGRPLEIVSYEGNVAYGRMQWSLHDDSVTTLTALEAACTIVFFEGGVEVLRMPIHLVPGEVCVVRP